MTSPPTKYGIIRASHFHYGISLIHYLVDSQTLVCLTEIRNVILRRNTETWANTDTQLGHNEFFKQNIIRQIATHELGGGGALKDSLGYSEMESEGAMT